MPVHNLLAHVIAAKFKSFLLIYREKTNTVLNGKIQRGNDNTNKNI